MNPLAAYGTCPGVAVAGYIFHPNAPETIYPGETIKQCPDSASYCITFKDTLDAKNGYLLRVGTIEEFPTEEEVEFNVVASGGEKCDCAHYKPPDPPAVVKVAPLVRDENLRILDPPYGDEHRTNDPLIASGTRPSDVKVHAVVPNFSTTRQATTHKHEPTQLSDQMNRWKFLFNSGALPPSNDLVIRLRVAQSGDKRYDQVHFRAVERK